MELEKQVCSLEYAQKLKELGCKQESIWCWWDGTDLGYELILFNSLEYCDRKESDIHGCSAYTVAELGEMLPSQYHSWKSILDEEGLGKGCLCVRFSEPEFDSSDEHWISADTEANARAKMLIWLIENKHMEV